MIDSGAAWFIVTDLDDFARQPELSALLEARASLAAKGDGYLVYDLRSYRHAVVDASALAGP